MDEVEQDNRCVFEISRVFRQLPFTVNQTFRKIVPWNIKDTIDFLFHVVDLIISVTFQYFSDRIEQQREHENLLVIWYRFRALQISMIAEKPIMKGLLMVQK